MRGKVHTGIEEGDEATMDDSVLPTRPVQGVAVPYQRVQAHMVSGVRYTGHSSRCIVHGIRYRALVSWDPFFEAA